MKTAWAILLGIVLLGCGEGRDARDDAVELEFRDTKGGRHAGYSPGRVAFEKGHTEPYTGRVLDYHANGNKETEIFYQDGRPHGMGRVWHVNGQLYMEGQWKNGRRGGMWLEWFANGQKKLMVPYRAGQRHGTVVTWQEDGTRAHEEVFEAGRRVRLIPGPEQERRRAALEQERARLDATVWRGEVAAQEREQVFVELWDDIRGARDKWVPLEKFPVENISLGKVGEAVMHDWGISERSWTRPSRALEAKGWQALVTGLRARGLQLRETEWHQELFTESVDGPRSVFAFVFHVEGEGARHIARGRLTVEWREGRRLPWRLVVEELQVWSRHGTPPFREWAVLDPRRDNPRALIPLAGSTGTGVRLEPRWVARDRAGREQSDLLEPWGGQVPAGIIEQAFSGHDHLGGTGGL